MDDETHNDLCNEFKKTIKLMQGIKHIITLIDTDKYYDIFSYNNKTYKIDAITYIRDTLEKSAIIIKYIVTTRKIGFMSITGDLLYILVMILKDDAHINKFFSLYTTSEITYIISNNIYGGSFYHDPYHKHIKLTMFFYSIVNNNALLFDYIVNHAEINNVIIMNVSTHMTSIASYNSMNTPNKLKLDHVQAQDTAVIFRLSLRYTWITGCIA